MRRGGQRGSQRGSPGTPRSQPGPSAHPGSGAREKTPKTCTQQGTWCSGITPVQHAGGPGFNPQCVHGVLLKTRFRAKHSPKTSLSGEFSNFPPLEGEIERPCRGSLSVPTNAPWHPAPSSHAPTPGKIRGLGEASAVPAWFAEACGRVFRPWQVPRRHKARRARRGALASVIFSAAGAPSGSPAASSAYLGVEVFCAINIY